MMSCVLKEEAAGLGKATLSAQQNPAPDGASATGQNRVSGGGGWVGLRSKT